jgi:hypothetical protein
LQFGLGLCSVDDGAIQRFQGFMKRVGNACVLQGSVEPSNVDSDRSGGAGRETDEQSQRLVFHSAQVGQMDVRFFWIASMALEMPPHPLSQFSKL